ncbi:MAG TPA: D-glycero-beta-D-manno-heptose-7-phosphate kinase [Nitrospirae bacterium]|nr:D-glycero-beta-D-manno-heptose-7-phosphate kinase [Nitrospirota bacterium]
MNIKEIFDNFGSKKILLLGDIILDCYIFGRVNRISPEAPVPVVEVVEQSYRLGGSANVANNIVSLGGLVDLAGTIGKDNEGELLKSECINKKIGITGIISLNKPTTVKTRIIAHNQQVVRFDREDTGKLDKDSYAIFMNFLKKHLNDYEAIIISDYKKGLITKELVSYIVRHFKGRYIAVDPKVGNFHCYKKTTIITPNKKEASEGSGIDIVDEKSIIKAGKELMKRLGLQAVLITRGEEGMTLFERSAKSIIVTHIPAAAKKVFDVTGAGDTVIATFCLAYLSGATMVQSAKIANNAAAIVIGQVGTATVAKDELLMSCQRL